MSIFSAVWSFVEKNRFLLVCIFLSMFIFFYGSCMEPVTSSVLNPEKSVTAKQLELEYVQWLHDVNEQSMKFNFASDDIAAKKASLDKLYNCISQLAQGNVGGFEEGMLFLIGGGGLGAIVDNIRKRGVISGLKMMKKA